MPNCFVVMGFGKKTDYVQQKTFDLDKSYKYIIKPAAEAAGYTCVRADEIQHAANINVPMYQQLFEADLVIADLSTSNANAFFELGVRYALKPRTTILIAEKGFKFPFDIGQIAVRSYEHLGDSIDYGEAQSKQHELAQACRAVAARNEIDSPVYTFLRDLTPPELATIARATERVAQAQTAEALAAATDENEKAALTKPLAVLMEQALSARAKGDFKSARTILAGIKAVQGAQLDPFVVQQLALSTYKSKDLEPRTALFEARAVLEELSPKSSCDPETLGLWGAIHKRLNEIGNSEGDRAKALEEAVWAYGKGFDLKEDYYNGINYAFLLDTRAAASSGDDAIADRVLAQRVRKRVLAACQEQLKAGIKGESERSKAEQEYWVRATVVEALAGLGRIDESATAFEAAKHMAPEPWMIDATEQQVGKLKALLATG